jgi:IS30 family transposase
LSKRSLIIAKQKIDMKEASIAEIATLHSVHPTTLSRAIKRISEISKI